MKQRTPIRPSDVPTDPFMRRSWFNTQLAMKGLNQTLLADRIGCTRQTISQCLSGPKSERVEGAMAEALNLTPQQLFPERHAADGSRLYRIVRTSDAA